MSPLPRFLSAAALCLLLVAPLGAQLRFRHHSIDKSLEGDAWGQTALADLDGDGDLDFILGRRNGVVIWYERVTNDDWRRHRISERSPSDVGGTALDVNRDGRPDFVAGGVWWENPGGGRDGDWTAHVFDPSLRGVHDLIAADVDGDSRLDIITMSGEMEGVTRSAEMDLRWYRIPEDPRGEWPATRVGDSTHSGLAAGDIDGDGDTDLVRSRVWFENLGDGARWQEHVIVQGGWKHASQARLADINGDGRLDLVLTEGEIRGARAAWYEAPRDPAAGAWKQHLLAPGDDDPRGPYHSLAVADFDLDGDLDVFTAEMEWLGASPFRWLIWENVSGDGSRFVERVIFNGGLGAHEAVVGDADGDGDLDIAAKLWRPVAGNANSGSNHADFLENLAR